jgi:hypothetical protein
LNIKYHDEHDPTQSCQIIDDDAKRNHKGIARFSNDGITRLNYNLLQLWFGCHIHHHFCCMEKFKMFITNSSSSSSRETKCIPTEEVTSGSSSSSAADASTQTAALGPSLLSCCWKL